MARLMTGELPLPEIEVEFGPTEWLWPGDATKVDFTAIRLPWLDGVFEPPPPPGGPVFPRTAVFRREQWGNTAAIVWKFVGEEIERLSFEYYEVWPRPATLPHTGD